VHANDSRSLSGSHHDVHANPGQGTIGARGLRLLSEVRALARVPWILEVPGKDHSGPRRRDVRRLRRIVCGPDHMRKTP
ncbi:MAG: deoxyribonuclease IV, partial [Chloroflexi bacterium]|nr:deoxyribonuclease IV [Chloroflexota bacterium]